MFNGHCASKVLQYDVSVEVGDGDPSNSTDIRAIVVLETIEATESGHVMRVITRP